MPTLPRRTLRALSLALLLSLPACTIAGGPRRSPNPHVTAATLQGAAVACASRGFSYVAHVDGQRWYCLMVNLENEPQAVPVNSALGEL